METSLSNPNIKKNSKPEKSNQQPLLLGALIGLVLYYVVSFLVLKVKFLGGPVSIFCYFLLGLAVGVITQKLTASKLLPKFIWLLLALVFWISLPLGIFTASIALSLVIKPGLITNIQLITNLSVFALGPIFSFGLWLFIARFAINSLTSQQVQKDTQPSNLKMAIALLGMVVLALTIYFSLLPGIGTKMLVGMFSLFGMVMLGIFAMGSKPSLQRTPGFMITIWLIPTGSLVALVILFLRELR